MARAVYVTGVGGVFRVFDTRGNTITSFRREEDAASFVARFNSEPYKETSNVARRDWSVRNARAVVRHLEQGSTLSDALEAEGHTYSDFANLNQVIRQSGAVSMSEATVKIRRPWFEIISMARMRVHAENAAEERAKVEKERTAKAADSRRRFQPRAAKEAPKQPSSTEEPTPQCPVVMIRTHLRLFRDEDAVNVGTLRNFLNEIDQSVSAVAK